jgi:hypothetical protein
MKKAMLLSGILVLILLVLLLRKSEPNVEAAEIRQHLETAMAQIETAQPGQIVYVVETSYRRPPPKHLEPSDPYHLPYTNIWQAEEHIERWVEFDEDNIITRWRTQARNDKDEITQDLLYTNGMEINYFPLEGRATRFEQEASPYRDGRLALIEDFLEQDDLWQRINITPGERSVLSIYADPQFFEGTDWDVETSLLFFNSPFLADIAPISRTIRIDFDPETWLPVGHGVSVWDQEGQEHIASYVTFVTHEILPATEAETVFHLEIPETAFSDTFSTSSGPRLVNNLSEITTLVNYPVYGIQDADSKFKLKSASLAVFDANEQPPTSLAGLLTPEIGVELSYVTEEKVLVVWQGPKEEIGGALRQMRPAWTMAEQITVQLGNENVTAWLLSTANATNVTYIIETNESLLYVKGQEVEHQLMLSFLEELRPFD